MKKILAFLLMVSVGATFLYAEGTTGAASLKIGLGARGQSLGGANTTSSEGAEALYGNPAGVGLGSSKAFMLGFQPMLEETSIGHAAAAGRFGRFGLGIGASVVQQSDLDAFDTVGNRTGNFSTGDNTLFAGAAWHGQWISLGASGKYWRSEIDDQSASVLAADVGVKTLSPLSEKITHALVVRNLGSDVSFISQNDPLPTAVILGSGFQFHKKLLFMLDVSWEQDAGQFAAGGLEWMAAKKENLMLALRGGYASQRNEADGLSGASFGIGLGFQTFILDYAWIPFGDLGDSHAVTLQWRPRKTVAAYSSKDPQKHILEKKAPAKGKLVPETPQRKRLDEVEPPRRK